MRNKILILALSGRLFSVTSMVNADLLPKASQNNVVLVDPEAPVELSTAPVAEPPVRVKLPEAIAEKDQWRGVQCAVTQPRQAVFRHVDTWERFWKQGLAPFSPKFAKVPAIDFSKDMVVGVFMGEKTDPHYEIEIQSVRIEQRDDTPTLVIHYRNIAKMSGVFTPPFAIQPFHLKRVPAFQGLMVFEEVHRSSPQ